MKKIVLSLAGVMAAVAFAPEASAVPVFARQTGMACSACHYQHFPLLNGFGRAFKAAGFTMMGAQGKVEGEHLDIPATLNMGVLTTTVYQTQSGNNVAPVATNRWMTPGTGGELSLFIGGRIAEFAGFLTEVGLSAPAASAGAAKLALLFPVADARVGLVIHSSNGQGVAYSYETLNTGAVNTHKMNAQNGPAKQHQGVYSAAQYFNTATAATGISLVANNSMGFINIGRYEAAGNGLVAGANDMPLTYVRGAATIDAAGMDVGFGLQHFTGASTVTGVEYKATIIDGQLQGDVAEMPFGLYASYGRAPAITSINAVTGLANVGFVIGQGGNNVPAVGVAPKTATSFNIGGEIGIIPHISTLQLALRSATNQANNKDNAVMVGATYELAQNIELSLTHTRQSGSAWNPVAPAVAAPVGKQATTLMMEALF